MQVVTGYAPELLSGAQEAALSFAGATAGMHPDEGPFLIVDIGGGSTELVLGSEAPTQVVSLDIGCVRMTDRFPQSDPPKAAELNACRAAVSELLAQVRPRIEAARARRVLGLTGPITALAGLKAGLADYDPGRTHGMVLTRRDVQALASRLANVPLEERRRLLLDPKLAEVIVAGALVLLAVLEVFDLPEFRVSEADILDGLAASLRARRPTESPVAHDGCLAASRTTG